MMIFNNSEFLTRSWYAVLRSANLKPGSSRSVEFFDHKVALFRDEKGVVGALYAYCPHMGADLGLGKVSAGSLVCPYHHWAFNNKGICTQKPGKPTTSNPASTHSYPAIEKYGYIWIFNGEKIEFPFPELEWSKKDHYLVSLPANLTRCHSHVLGTNVADFHHLETLHGFVFDGEPKLIEESDYKLVHHYRINLKPKGIIEKLFCFYAGNIYDFHISLYGDNNVIMKIDAKNYSLRALINISLSANGHSYGRTILFIPKGKGIVRLLRLNLLKIPVILASFIKVQLQDVKLFNNIRFRPNPGEKDRSVLRYMDLVERLGAFSPDKIDKCSPSRFGQIKN